MRLLHAAAICCQLCCITILFAACQTHSSPEGTPSPATSTGIDKLRLEETIKTYSALYEKGDVAGFMNMYADDAEMLTPDGHVLVGKEQIQNMWSGMMQSGMKWLNIAVTDRWGDGSLIATQGNWSAPDKKGSAFGRGKFIFLWKKQDKEWKVFRDIFSMEPVATTSTK